MFSVPHRAPGNAWCREESWLQEVPGSVEEEKDPLLEGESTQLTKKLLLNSFDPRMEVPFPYSFLEGCREGVSDTVLGL